MNQTELVNLLKELGLNGLEAEVYCTLLENPGVTAYKIGKLIKKATANVYKAVESLSARGGIIVKLNGKNKCYAVEPREFFDLLNASFKKHQTNALRILELKHIEFEQEGIYHLESAQLVVQKAKSAIDNCKEFLTIDVFPAVFQLLKQNLINAQQRGVSIYLQVYDDSVIENVQLIKCTLASEVINSWNSEQLNLVADGRESIIALFDRHLKTIHQAIWTTDLYISCMFHLGFMREHCFHQIKALSSSADLPPEIDNILSQQGFLQSPVQGFQELIRSISLKDE